MGIEKVRGPVNADLPPDAIDRILDSDTVWF
jgi:hypothetical protein